MDFKCHSRWHRCWHYKVCGLTLPGILDSCTEFYMLWQSARRRLSIFANVDTCQLLFSCQHHWNRIAGWQCRPPVADVTDPMPSYFTAGYCNGNSNIADDRGSSGWRSHHFFQLFLACKNIKKNICAKEKNKRSTDWQGASILSNTNSPTPLPPLVQWFHSINRGISIVFLNATA